PDRAGHHRPGRGTAAVPTHSAVGGAATQRAVPALAEDGLHVHPRAATDGADRHLLVPRGTRVRDDQTPGAVARGRGGGQREYPPPRPRQGTAPAADAELSRRM